MPSMAFKTLLLSACLAAFDLATAQSTPSCAIPVWTLDDMKLSFRNPSRANFTLSNLVGNTSEPVSCALEFTTLCEIKGTPGDKDLYIHLQTKGEDVWVNVTRPWACNGRTGHVTGSGERLYECLESDVYTCSAGKIVVNGTFVDW